MQRTRWLITLLSMIGLAAGSAAAADPPHVRHTIDNLQTAYQNELNTETRCKAFAQRADQEGYPQVALLFRAVAASKAVCALRFSRVVQGMGARPLSDMQAPEAKTTAENLRAAITSESYERDALYPAFIERAKQDGSNKAITAFISAIAVKNGHGVLFADALKDLPSWRSGERQLGVCRRCGFTTVETPKVVKKCPVCGEWRRRFEEVR